MRFALIGPTYPFRGGIAHHTTLLFRHLAARNDGLFVSFRRLYPAFLYPGATDRDPSEHPLREPCDRVLDPMNPVSWWRAADRIARFAPEAVVAAWWTTFLAPALGTVLRTIRRRTPVRVMLLCHNVLPHEPHPWDRALARFALKAGHRHIVQSTSEEQVLRQLLPAARPVVHPHPVYDMFSGQMVPRAEARRRLGLPVDGRLLLFFGLVRPYKGLHHLLEALPEARRALPDLHLLVAGEIWGDPAPYFGTIERLGIGQAVTVVDSYIPDERVPLCFSAADVVVLPYVRGSQSGVAQLAFGCGRPVIATTSGGMGALVREGDNGLLVQPSDSGALARAIVRFFQGGLGDRLRAGAARPATEHAWVRLVEAIERVAATTDRETG